jgi:hypothetical protein
MADASVKDVKEFFGMTLTQMKEEWVKGGLSDQDKKDILQGLSDETLTY